MCGRIAIVGLMLVFCILGLGCKGAPPPADPGEPGGDNITVETLLESAEHLVSMVFTPDGRALFTEKETGRIRVISDEGEILETPFADVPVVANGERGLLGITVHPDFEENGYVYAFYTRSNTGEDTRTGSAAQDNRVVRFTAEGDVGVDETLIIALPIESASNHNGGNIHFGPDVMLYITYGDIGNDAYSQMLDVLPGRILRINDDGSIPDDGPFGQDNPTYALGLRNSFDFTFDPVSGEIFATENGTFLHDEINRLPAMANGGWPIVEGLSGGAEVNVEHGDYMEPLIETEGSVVPTGIAFATDATFGQAAQNRLFVGQFNTGRILLYRLNDERTAVTAESIFAQSISGGITDLAFAPDGTLYVVTTTSILRIVPNP